MRASCGHPARATAANIPVLFAKRQSFLAAPHLTKASAASGRRQPAARPALATCSRNALNAPLRFVLVALTITNKQPLLPWRLGQFLFDLDFALLGRPGFNLRVRVVDSDEAAFPEVRSVNRESSFPVDFDGWPIQTIDLGFHDCLLWKGSSENVGIEPVGPFKVAADRLADLVVRAVPANV